MRFPAGMGNEGAPEAMTPSDVDGRPDRPRSVGNITCTGILGMDVKVYAVQKGGA